MPQWIFRALALFFPYEREIEGFLRRMDEKLLFLFPVPGSASKRRRGVFPSLKY